MSAEANRVAQKFGEKLEAQMLEQRMTRKTLSKRSGVSLALLNRVLCGDPTIKFGVLMKLVHSLGCTIESSFTPRKTK
jgi:transcriptional regulator with XRE-family HTH domain